jgi:hypothetical protein
MSEDHLLDIKFEIRKINESMEKCLSEINDTNVSLIDIKTNGDVEKILDQLYAVNENISKIEKILSELKLFIFWGILLFLGGLILRKFI